MERVNHTSSVSDFSLLGLSSDLSTRSHSAPFFIRYVVTMVRNFLVVLAIHLTLSSRPPYVLSFPDVCYATTIVPEMLMNFLPEIAHLLC